MKRRTQEIFGLFLNSKSIFVGANHNIDNVLSILKQNFIVLTNIQKADIFL